ncbi:regulator of chromosome condensation 1/beta-lactamase-inhibitor protein II [Phycomyces nitens]|nr:regulator of chromosome condensation 1/beta-lactamase-inhibitor protein II [Phycomyces nitens]
MPIKDLPWTVWQQVILPLLDASSLARLSETSRHFYQLANDEYLWRNLVFDDYNLSHDVSYREKGWKTLYGQLEHSAVYTWGENSDGRLGFGQQRGNHFQRMSRSVTTPRELTTLRGKGIVSISSGGWSFHGLSKQGEVWMWGTMDSEWEARSTLAFKPVSTPTLVNLPPGTHITSLACGRSHAVAMERNPMVAWNWDNLWRPKKVIFVEKLVQVAATWRGSIALTSNGVVCIMDLPTPTSTMNDPYEQESLWQGVSFSLDSIRQDASQTQKEVLLEAIEEGDRIVQVAGLENSMIALSLFGKVFKIVLNKLDQLQNSPAAYTTLLAPFSATLNEVNDRQGTVQRFISGAFRQFAVYTTPGRVLLGQQDTDYSGEYTLEEYEEDTSSDSEQDQQEDEEQDPHQPYHFHPFAQRNRTSTDGTDRSTVKIHWIGGSICNVSFGDYHTGALTTDGSLYTWGKYSSGALGHGPNLDDVHCPKKVRVFDDKFVFGIGFGGWQSSALVISKEVETQ